MQILHQKRILITRTRHQASDLAARLEALGATPILIPTIEIVPPESYATLDAALMQLEAFDWLLFTSANAVDVFQRRRNFSLHPGRIAVIGPATARAVQGIGLQVDLIPSQYIAESLVESLAAKVPGKRVLLVRAAEARDILPEALTAAGAKVIIADAYHTRTPPESIPALQQIFSSQASYPDAITFTSASTVRNLMTLLEAAGLALPSVIALASIGPITSQALRVLGYAPTVEAVEPTLPALVEAMENYFNRREKFQLWRDTDL
ncbi:MAG: uroporphyrinogen-III synthase [Edaphobacter sp.]